MCLEGAAKVDDRGKLWNVRRVVAEDTGSGPGRFRVGVRRADARCVFPSVHPGCSAPFGCSMVRP